MKVLSVIYMLVTAVAFCQGLSILYRSDTQPWEPEKGSRGEWLRCHGYPCDEWNNTMVKMREFQKMLLPDGFQPKSINETDDSLDTCIWLTGDQLDDLMHRHEEEKNHTSTEKDHSRRKRKLQDFESNGFAMWPTGYRIRWKFDGMHDSDERDIIRGGIKHWEENTCVRFQEVSTNDYVMENHVLITREPTGCHSFIGRVNRIPQQLNLQSECVNAFGTIVHEIGHVLGLWHEQQRKDRVDHVRVNEDNLGFYSGQFVTQSSVYLGVPYDIGSVMHYSGYSGSKNGLPTMEPLDPLYTHNMGQRTGLSFNDAKIINRAYCQDNCKGELPRPCERDGYRDPNNCDRCRCPDGFGGTYCETVASPVKADCGGKIMLGRNREIIQSPGFLEPRYYENHQECNWYVQAPPNHQVSLEFVGDFGLYCYHSRQCHHWVEVKYEQGLNKAGPRFCCNERPKVILESTGGEMMVTFRANWTQAFTSVRRGFRALVHAVPNSIPEIPTPPLDLCSMVDLIFLLDSSGSVMKANWEKIQLHVKSLAFQFPTITNNGTRIGLISFGNNAMIHFNLTTYNNIYDVLSAIDRVPFKNERTNTAAGLELARNMLAGPEHRAQARQVVVLITDGKSDNPSETMKEAAMLEEREVQVYVVGVGYAVDFTEALNIAGRESRMIYVDDFNSLGTSSTAQLGFNKICNYTQAEETSIVAWHCDFDTKENTWCGMSQEGEEGDEFDWTIGNGPTPSYATGPESATSGQSYIFIEATGRNENDKARINFPKLAQGSAYCVTFDYSMYGFHVRSLRLYVRRSTGDNSIDPFSLEGSNRRTSQTLWYRTRDHGQIWYQARVEVQLSADDMLGLEATRGGGYSGDIAVDSMRITRGGCKS